MSRQVVDILQQGIRIVINKTHTSNSELMLCMCDPKLQLTHCENTLSRSYVGHMTMALLNQTYATSVLNINLCAAFVFVMVGD